MILWWLAMITVGTHLIINASMHKSLTYKVAKRAHSKRPECRWWSSWFGSIVQKEIRTCSWTCTRALRENQVHAHMQTRCNTGTPTGRPLHKHADGRPLVGKHMHRQLHTHMHTRMRSDGPSLAPHIMVLGWNVELETSSLISELQLNSAIAAKSAIALFIS